MRHNRQTKRLGRTWSERKALLESLVSSLLVHQQIKTTLQKAKQARRLADHVITLGKKDTLSSRRQVFSYLQDHELTSKVFKEIAPRFKSRQGGYTRVMHLGLRKGDGAQLAILELTEKEIKIKEPKKAKKGKTAESPKHDKEHEHKHEHAHPDMEEQAPKRPEPGKEKPKPGFLKNLGKFFRNKGFGNKGG
jgi:large subunit ribosomal protein L17